MNINLSIDMLKDKVIIMINNMYEDEEFYFQQDGAPPHYVTKVRTPLMTHSPENRLDVKVRLTGLLGRMT